MIDYGNEKEIDRYPDLFENGKRKYYLSNDITIENTNDVISVSRNISKINDNVKLFISSTDSNLNGISMDKILSYVKELKIID